MYQRTKMVELAIPIEMLPCLLANPRACLDLLAGLTITVHAIDLHLHLTPSTLVVDLRAGIRRIHIRGARVGALLAKLMYHVWGSHM